MTKARPLFIRCGMAALLAGWLLIGGTLEVSASQALDVVKPVTGCASLAVTDLTGIGGEGSKVTAVTETTSDGIPVCSVEGMLAPAINFQVLLPSETWTQRYLQVGCGGLCGNITLRSGASDGCKVLTDGGFVMAATDMGHQGQDASWGLDPQKRADFAYRAQHVTAQAARALIAAYYGQGEKFSYFNGCSDGGREALMEAQRFPNDFDGIVSGAPAMLFQVQNTLHHGWLAAANTGPDGKGILTSARLPLLHKAVLAACDAQDGLVDGLISQPALCAFEPAMIACAAGATDRSSCLMPAEAEAARKIYDGPRDAATGAALTAGQPLYGSELEWQGVFVADSADAPVFSAFIAQPVLRSIAFAEPRPDASFTNLAFSTATLDALRARHPLFDATNTDLGAFQAAGGKLILWHGLADPHISPANTLSYHKGLIRDMGEATVEGFERLYLLPGVGHCSGGQGPSKIDLLSAMMAWVEDGTAPDAVLTSSTAEASSFGQPDGVAGSHGGGRPHAMDLGVAPLPDMTRPAYPWPYTATYNGTGKWTDSANWTKGAAAEIGSIRDWPGANFFGHYTIINE